ncbi:hydrolase Nlp/P60 [Flavobacteriaceae bacterium Ap0902]|nr:hydrolase Nlp/P60 [Flavobacteriaceae bacterium Ap0902]
MGKKYIFYTSIFTLFFVTELNAQASFANNFNSTIPQETLVEKDLPEEPEEVLSEIEIMILKEIGKALSYEERKSTIFSLISEAKTYIGTPYVYGGTTRRGIDCSAFMQSVFKANEIDLPRVSRNQALVGDQIEYQDIEPGDMIFFSNSPNARISHVGMVVEVTADDIRFIHAGSSTGVTISPLSMAYWKKRFRYAKRVFGEKPEEIISKNSGLTLNKS